MSHLISLYAGAVQEDRADVQMWMSVFVRPFTNQVWVDRTNTIIPPYNVRPHAVWRMPQLITNTRTYEELCFDRVDQIVQTQDRLGLPITFGYSGGVDSTTALCAFIARLGVKQTAERVKIICSLHSIDEYPRFFYQTLLPNFELIPSALYAEYLADGNIFVDGEPNGLILGPEATKRVSMLFGAEFLSRPITYENVQTYYDQHKNNRSNQFTIQALIDIVMLSSNAAAVVLRDMYDFLWWIAFNFRWQTVCSRILFRVFVNSNPGTYDTFFKDRLFPFFDTVGFQTWGYTNRDLFRQRLSPKDFKRVCKELIFSVTGDRDYLLFKDKQMSRGNRYMGKPHAHITPGIDNNWQAVTQDHIEDFYVPNNFFMQYR